MARWEAPGPPQFGGAPITSIRNVKSQEPALAARWLDKGSRCVVPAMSFCKYAGAKAEENADLDLGFRTIADN
jgi:hypothetical protein